MSKQRVGRVTPAERDEIRELFLRKSALAELFASLSRLDRQSLEQSPLYEKIVGDMAETGSRFQGWWSARARHYGWPDREGGSWSIDFATCEVFLG